LQTTSLKHGLPYNVLLSRRPLDFSKLLDLFSCILKKERKEKLTTNVFSFLNNKMDFIHQRKKKEN
jgi:hypothetical protein